MNIEYIYIYNCIYFLKISTLWIFRIVYILWKIVYIRRTKLKNYVHWIHKNMFNIWNIVYVEYTKLKNWVHWMYEIMYILWKFVYFQCTKFRTFLEKFCILNIHNCISFLKDCVIRICKNKSIESIELKNYVYQYT